MEHIIETIRKIFCFFGFHSYTKKCWFFGDIKIIGRECEVCKYSPTWNR